MLRSLSHPELVIGICSPLATNNNKVSEIIQNALKVYDYNIELYKVTQLMSSLQLKEFKLYDSPYEKRVSSHIQYANELRHIFQDQSALAKFCVAAIRAYRRKRTQKENEYKSHQAYILDQFKRPEEIELLRSVYGRLFILVSVHSDKNKRKNKIAHAIAESESVRKQNLDIENRAAKLIAQDEEEAEVPSGQRMKDAFALADLFIDIDNEANAIAQTERFFAALFGSNRVSPTRAEYGMYQAKSASLRSSDLSRQVGAAIVTREGELVCVGCNEVPKAGGGTYWSGDANDARDHILGRDENDNKKRSILTDLVDRLVDDKLIDIGSIEKREFIEKVVDAAYDTRSRVKKSQMMDLLEFSRVIHAEMCAITDAARLGRGVRSCDMYVTTFPCHMCAKHIVAAGIDNVYYIEPYAKSYAAELHQDSILVDSLEKNISKVNFVPFIGISPYRYRDLFERTGKRKDGRGNIEEWLFGAPRVIMKYPTAFYLVNEEIIVRQFKRISDELVARGVIKAVI